VLGEEHGVRGAVAQWRDVKHEDCEAMVEIGAKEPLLDEGGKFLL
jgi:hypothetical protein